MSDIKENTQKFSCECCDYFTDRKANYTRHMNSKKHAKKLTGEETTKTRKPRMPKTKKNVTEISIQTDQIQEEEIKNYSEISIQTDEIQEENIDNDYMIELENTNSSLEDENNALKFELEEKNEELQQLKIIIEQLRNSSRKLEEAKAEEIREIVNDCNDAKGELIDQIEDLKIENEKKDKKIQTLTSQIEDLKKENEILGICPSKTPTPEEPTLKCVKREEDDYLTKENFESLNKENLLLTNELIQLQEELDLTKVKLSNLNIEKFTHENNNDDDKKKKTKKIKTDNLKNPIEIFKELCYDSKFNNKIMSNSYIDKSNKHEIVKINILKSIDKECYQIKPSKLYQQIFTSVIEEMNERNIKFIRCVDTRRNKFEIHDGTEWKKYNESEFESIIIVLMNHITNSFYNAISNTTDNVDVIEFMKIYKKSKEYFLSEEGSKSEIVLSILNPLYDDTLNFAKTIINLCKKICKNKEKKSISKKSCRKSSRKKYDSDDDDSDSDTDDDSDDDSDSQED